MLSLHEMCINQYGSENQLWATSSNVQAIYSVLITYMGILYLDSAVTLSDSV